MELLRKKFVEDASDLLLNLERDALELENNPTNIELTEQVFRVMHTFKGVSGMYGFDSIVEYTHQLETIYDLIRSKKIKVDRKILDITFESVDHLRNLLHDADFSDPKIVTKHQKLVKKLSAMVGKYKVQPQKKQVENKQIKSATITDIKTYYVIFKPNENMLNRGINLLGIFEELSELGDYKIVNHKLSDFETSPDFENIAWGVYIATNAGKSSIEEAFLFVIDDCRILKVSDFNLFNQKDFLEKLEKITKEKDIKKAEFFQKNILEKSEQLKDFNETNKEPETTIEDKKQAEAISEALELIQDKPEKQNDEEKIEANKSKDISKSPASNKEIQNIGHQLTSRIQVESTKLDTLMYLVSELVTTKAQLNLIAQKKDYTKLNDVVEKIDKLSKQFRDNSLSIRLVPISDMILQFKRLIRDLSHKLGKEVDFLTQGTDTELDKNIIDIIAEPIMHILRNCLDHGIEDAKTREKQGKSPKGIIKLTAYYSGANVFIQIQDDGAGIDIKKVKAKAIKGGFISPNATLSNKEANDLIFLSGFSTAQNLTEISGRGVGMDVVKRKIAEVRGEVEVDSEKGLGTSFTIKLQQTISIIDTLLVKINNDHFLIPLSEVEACDEGSKEQLFKTKSQRLEFGNNLIPFIYLRDEFDLDTNGINKHKYIVIRKNDKRVALLVDLIVGEHQAVLKPLGEMFNKQNYISGASILGDGTLALMIDTAVIISNQMIDKD